MKLFRKSPEIAREAGRKRWEDPEAREEFGIKRRGFHVPPEHKQEYRRLRFKLGSQEAGKLMGLI